MYSSSENKNIEEYFFESKFKISEFLEDLLKEYKIIHVDNVGFYMFNEYWIKTDEGRLKNIIQNKLSTKLTRFRVNEVLELIKNKTYTDVRKLNNKKNRLVLKNGTLDLSDWTKPVFYENKFYETDYSTIQLNCRYNKNALAETFSRFLLTTFSGDRDLILLVLELLGYCLTTSTKYQKAFIFYGEGSNGKSVLINIIIELLTLQNISTVGMASLDKPFERSSLLNKLVNISAEADGTMNNTGNFKKIVAGDLIDAQFKYKNPFEFNPYCKLIYALNKLPYSRDRSDGYYRRFIIIPFENKFEGNSEDKELSEKLSKELDGILQFALFGLKRLGKFNSFTPSQKVNEELSFYKRENNPIEDFIDIYIKIEEEGRISTKELYEEYRCYCSENGLKPLSNSNFGRELKRICPKVVKNRPCNDGERDYFYCGVRLKK